jgi:uncharacterized membrane protein YhaH (DUF805 family)
LHYAAGATAQDMQSKFYWTYGPSKFYFEFALWARRVHHIGLAKSLIMLAIPAAASKIYFTFALAQATPAALSKSP